MASTVYSPNVGKVDAQGGTPTPDTNGHMTAPQNVQIASGGQVTLNVGGNPVSNSNPIPIQGTITATPAGVQGVSAASGAFVTGSIVDLATLAGVVSSSKAAVKSAAGDIVDLATIAAAITASIMQINLSKVGGNAVAVGSNAVPVLNIASAGYVAAYGSNAANTTGGADYSFKWGAGGNTQVNRVLLQNNTGANISYDFDTATNAGSPILATGQTLLLDVQVSTLHLQSAGNQNVNGAASGNIVIRAWL